jgi:hypothetical protein
MVCEWYQKLHSLRQNIASAIKVLKGRKSIDEDKAEVDDD